MKLMTLSATLPNFVAGCCIGVVLAERLYGLAISSRLLKFIHLLCVVSIISIAFSMNCNSCFC